MQMSTGDILATFEQKKLKISSAEQEIELNVRDMIMLQDFISTVFKIGNFEKQEKQYDNQSQLVVAMEDMKKEIIKDLKSGNDWKP